MLIRQSSLLALLWAVLVYPALPAFGEAEPSPVALAVEGPSFERFEGALPETAESVDPLPLVELSSEPFSPASSSVRTMAGMRPAFSRSRQPTRHRLTSATGARDPDLGS